MRAQTREAGAGPVVLLEWILKGSRRRNFEGNGRRGRRYTGRREESNAEVTTYRFRVTSVTDK